MKNDQVNNFIERITLWVSAQSDIQALGLVGSYARNAASATSDIDLILVVDDLNRYLHNPKWVEQFGVIEKKQMEYYGLVTSIRVWYTNRLEVEYGIADERWAALPLAESTRQVIRDGLRVLFERGNLLSCHLTP